MEILLSIFTPTYNRANHLAQLYDSLCSQEEKNFEWIIVDDGSTDNTEEVVKSFKSENKIPINYFKKENEGKHIAINIGVEMAKGYLFFIVDSDDYLTKNATNKIAQYLPQIKDNHKLGGISFRRGHTETQLIGTKSFFDDVVLSIFDFRYRMNIKGDMAEVYKTEIMRKFPFPKFEKEKFCAESLVWNRIGLKYDMLWTSSIIYICHYLEDGLTNQNFEIRKKSPLSSTLYYSEFEKMPIPLLTKLKANINYWRFSKYVDISCAQKFKRVNPIYSLIGYPLSFVFLITDEK